MNKKERKPVHLIPGDWFAVTISHQHVSHQDADEQKKEKQP